MTLMCAKCNRRPACAKSVMHPLLCFWCGTGGQHREVERIRRRSRRVYEKVKRVLKRAEP